MGIFDTILNGIRRFGKPIANVINGVIQSLDATGEGRYRVMNDIRLARGLPILTLDGYPKTLASGEENAYMRVLGEASADEREEAAAVYTAEQARGMNVILNEIPFFSNQDYDIVLNQSYSITVPTYSGIVQEIYANPLMNLGGRLVNLAQEYRVMRVNSIEIRLERQNEIYSTRVISYNPVITKRDRNEMINDLEQYYANGPNVPENTNPKKINPLGSRTLFFYGSTDLTQEQKELLQAKLEGYEIHDFVSYVRTTNKLQELAVSKTVEQLPESTLGIAQPGMRLVGMTKQMNTNPVYYPGMEYVALDYTDGFLVDNNGKLVPDRNMVSSQMPVYGAFYMFFSNMFNKDVDQILTIQYHLTCKQRIDGSTYNDPDGDPLL